MIFLFIHTFYKKEVTYIDKDITELKNIEVQTVNPDMLADIQDVKIDTNLSRDEKIKQFLEQIKNPYCFKCGKTIIKISFADTEKTIENRMQEYLKTLLE